MHDHSDENVMLLDGVPFAFNHARENGSERFVSPEGDYQLWTVGVGGEWWTNVWERQPGGEYLRLELLDVTAENYLEVIYQFLRQRGYAPLVANHRVRVLEALVAA